MPFVEAPETTTALRELAAAARDGGKPLLLWIGAGAGAWLGYPLWDAFAASAHSHFLRLEANYNTALGAELLNAGEYPSLFQLCAECSRPRLNSLLAKEFGPRPVTPVYERFVRGLHALSPVFAVTTNVDETLEGHLSPVVVLQRTDIERAVELLGGNQSFLAKLHGTTSAIESTVFTSDEYKRLLQDESFTPNLARILGASSVLFLGYGLRDDYVVNLLVSNAGLARVFGDGPHFAVVPNASVALPATVRKIVYKLEPHKDHRSALHVLEEVVFSRLPSPARVQLATTIPGPEPQLRSAHLLWDILPPGTWQTSQKLNVVSQATGKEKQIVIGNGFTNAEFPSLQSTAMHDLIVGLVCFDEVFAPLTTIDRLHNLLTPGLFWDLVRCGALRFIYWGGYEGVEFPQPDAVAGGHIETFQLFNPDLTPHHVRQVIREHLRPLPGKEDTAEPLFELLQTRTVNLAMEQQREVATLTRGLLARPSIRRLLGLSEGTPVDSLPRWVVFPVLRLASVVKTGATCRALGLASLKLDFGATSLAGPAFAATLGCFSPDEGASYVVSGRYGVDLGEAALADRTIVDSIIRFRDTQAAATLRKELLNALAVARGADLAAAVNGGLATAIQPRVLQEARNQFVRLYTPATTGTFPEPVLWNDERYADAALAAWRRQSKAALDNYCLQLGVSPYHPCPCGSGDRLKFCCLEALSA